MFENLSALLEGFNNFPAVIQAIPADGYKQWDKRKAENNIRKEKRQKKKRIRKQNRR